MKIDSETDAYDHVIPPISKRAREAWLKALTNLVAVHSPLAVKTFDRIDGRSDLTSADRIRLDRLRPWIENMKSPSNGDSVENGEIPFGVMGYRCPDHVAASRNIGDWVQTIAMMSHFTRRPNLDYTGERELVDFFSGLRDGVPADRQISGPSKTIRLIEINRDATFHDKLPETVWAFVFGWYFKLPSGKLEFPFPKNIRPIFISFHISNVNHITDEAISYLKDHAPIGCRDLHTVRLLRKKGVECYFSGCVTTTTGGLFEKAKTPSDMPVAYVDATVNKIPDEAVALTNLLDEMKTASLATSLCMARDRLNDYRTKFSKIVTSRLHTYLPSESMGVNIDWLPVHADDRRFDGLAGPNEMNHRQMENRIEEIVRVLLDAVLAGATQTEVYDAYRREVALEIERADNLVSQ
ncbi:polysaccharide pyruvyl transferase family protein [Falsirhodobacter halotolerans]|uniref:polysaccharide pyruvyl transferase family protein n=1 Tax=Falsirhodobacter halotolerans TaxID=1146892 RepID=UPI001FD3B0CC|nr:polysaccharide pyruvyl transferase family protein [Falsirhodobacter halotolerans]MCJ8139538.1 polysaccharide pyruvyl transferase family protein [Falsirhodobacter halotolerans]